jgi:hypothetical protein
MPITEILHGSKALAKLNINLPFAESDTKNRLFTRSKNKKGGRFRPPFM